MRRSESIGNLAAALAKAQARMQHAKRDAKNPHFNSRYADLASIVDATEPLNAEELSFIQVPSTPEAGLVAMITLLAHSSGEWLESDELRVQARDAGPQAVGSCLTYLRRYQLACLVGIAPDDDDDGEAIERPVLRPAPKPKKVEPPPILNEGDAVAFQPVSVPDGFHYVVGYQQRDEWHEATLTKWTADGSGLKVSTKLHAIGKLLGKAFELGIPIRPDVTMKKGRTDEAYLNKVVFYDAEQPDGDRG